MPGLPAQTDAFDLLHLPLIGPLLRRKIFRTLIRLAMLAIAAGMIAESYIARKKGLITAEEEAQITGYLLSIYGKIEVPNDPQIIEIMRQDKKNKANKILMALPRGIGNAIWDVDVNEEQVIESLSFFETMP